ncbi:LysM peptidoglycan-binding domain-containing protein [Acinetobacter sp. MD2(2019)]|uniref:LysM peptidoglycan-binding domain-containing protein n=1 Tax=Acinetobacter sp. MD2(2019) TaxID=2605273 RepID=UPI002D1F7199|nr:LysM peptidoglycan-binding domain-containing protein [Acinetobacter sp. MD2(2019)]MEB3753739.1 LysM peptidoglycan-binding domain-containing protein [Acinetobacter sp. MD2(2019)]
MLKPTTGLWQLSVPQFFKLSFLSSTIAALAFTTGCSSTTSTTNPTKSKQVGSGDYLDASSLDSLQDLLSATDMRAVEGDRLLILKHGDVWKRIAVGFKMDENHWDPRIDAQRSWFISRQPYLDRLSARASRYLYHTVKEAERRGMPTELALLPVIESSYDPAATSSASAAGLWQFIPSTGRIYGLQQTGSYDARRDVVESTRAAYEFLGSLYNQFGSWELALAAYNAGPGRVQQAINRNAAAGLPTDYWSLKLPAETMNYVPRFLAVAQIVKNPRAYGVNLPPIANRPHFREVKVPAGASLNDISSLTGLSRTELYSLNPGYRGENIDPASPGRILIPSDISPAVDKKLTALKTNYSGSSAGLFANNSPATTSNVTVLTPSKTTPPPITTTPSTNPNLAAAISRPSTANPVKPALKNTPQDASALAMFANNADVPSAPRIPVAVATATEVKKPISVEPPISSQERTRIESEIRADNLKNETVKKVIDPVASTAEQQQVVNEIKSIAPTGTEIVDPYDGKIKLTAIQTSLSVAENQGKEVSKSFAYPKQLVDATPATSPDVQRNQGKNFIKTDTDVVVVAPKGVRTTYTVIAGDTLAIIAMKNGVAWRDIAKWNQIDPDAPLFTGTKLYLYDAKPQANSSTKNTVPDSYTVKANESLTSIASQFGLTVKQLADWNDLSVSSNLLVGQKLSLKAPSDTSSRTPVTQTANNKSSKVKTKVYVVKRGEYLKIIADRYALSVPELVDLNTGLSASSALMVGQKINVPLQEVEAEKTTADTSKRGAEKIATESYKVQRGDTLNSIAAKSKMSLADFAQLNNLKTSSNVRVGQVLKVPEGTNVPDVYTVKSGDNLSNIASQYNLNLDDVAKLNGLKRNSGVRVGQRLKLTGDLPADDKSDDSNSSTYVVKSGDTLASVAKKYYLKQAYLADLNGLKVSAKLHSGQSLKLTEDKASAPDRSSSTSTASSKSAASTLPKNTESYTVQAGESLTSLASRYSLSVKDLADLNGLSAKTSLRRGQKINVPKLTVSYKVKSGDSLIRLASKYNVDVKTLADMNNLEPSASLRLGTTLKVPNQ